MVGAFLVGNGRKALIIGDVLSGGRIDQWVPDGDLAIVSPEYISDLAAMRRSLSALLNLDFDIMCFGHGTPIFDSPKEVFRRCVESDEVWNRLERLKEQRGPKLAM